MLRNMFLTNYILYKTRKVLRKKHKIDILPDIR